MAKEQKFAPNSEKKTSWTPFVIIGLIFAVTILGIYLITQSGDADPNSGSSSTSSSTSAGSSNGSSPAETAQSQPIANYANAPSGATPAHFKGSESAAVVVEEFADFQCPTCAVVHPRMNEIVSQFGSRIRFVFRNYPLRQIHRNAYDAAVAAEAAGMQNKFWEMQNLLFTNQARWSNAAQPRPLFEEYAQTIGLNIEKFKDDMLGLVAQRRVDLDLQRAQALNLSGTPSILVNGRPVNSFETTSIAQAIEAELARIEKSREAAEQAPAEGGESPANSSDGNQ
ncbi:MAG: hypothetical protein DWQ47_13505 [Acidobacteria bacterium]|nr:MAG: hypothetical protein DWQ32_00905 [Acidobacteriota bacterium]REK02910.1 MAG: hypothetical protein DWQ38_11230 [Acidobacteriota bacterium]REK13286.1 MAG: hypothetical protein DWQ43_06595 [Acidobacteriota bacterium]REK41280.1 MAG: hypothetical protein DWQ47_13505 [Acidobacteriota bacterium]